MEKISTRVNEKNVIDLDFSVKENISNLSDYLNKNPENLTACILDRPRHKKIIEEWKYIRNISIDSMKKVLDILNHDFDLWLGESDVNELIEPMIELLKDEGKVAIDDNALVSTQDSNPKILIAKSDGSYLYLTTDIATIKNRLENYDFDKFQYHLPVIFL